MTKVSVPIVRRYVIAPDSFKGTMSSLEICDLIEYVIRQEDPDAHVVKVPIADGGEGFVEAYLNMCGGSTYEEEVSGPLFNPVNARWGMLTDGQTAIIEMSSAAGLTILPVEERNPEKTTTSGVGELIVCAVQKGAQKIILGLGGSATNDGGIGMAHVLGYRFLDDKGNVLSPVGSNLIHISRITAPHIKLIPESILFEAACDVNNTIFGSNGAAYIYGPQKGADLSMVERLDRGLENLAHHIQTDLGIDIVNLPGGGAAGGLGAGTAAFLGAKLHSGIDLLLDAVGFDDIVCGADYVFTGEGRLDGQSISGKAPVGIARRAKRHNVPVIGIAGSIGRDIDLLYDMGFTSIISTISSPGTLEETLDLCREDLSAAVKSIIRLIVSKNR